MNLLNRLLDAGMQEGLAPGLQKRVLIANRLALTTFLITAPFIAIFWAAGQPTLGVLVIPVTLGYLAVPLLNGQRLYGLARLCILLTGNVAPLLFALNFGRGAGIHLYLFAIMCLPIVVLDPKDKALIGLMTALPVLLFLALNITEFFGVQPVQVAPEAASWIHLAMILATSSSIIAALEFLYISNVRAERGLAETVARLRREKDLFQSIFRSVGDIVFLVDRDGRYLAINPQVSRYGAKAEDIVGKTIWEIMRPELADDYARLHEQVFRTGEPATFERPHPIPDGTFRTFEITLSAARDATGAVTSLVGVSRDVTDERQVAITLRAARDAADVASNSKTFFLANVSHELRTPLAVISGFAEMLRDATQIDAAARRAIAMIQRNCQHLNALVGDILDVSLIEAGQLRIIPMTVPLQSELAAAMLAPESAAKVKNLSFEVSYADTLPATANLDPLRLRQIVTNIVGNAVKFTEAGGILVRVGATNAHGAWLLEITVRDTGCGITAAQADGLFQPFTQVDPSTSRKYGGTGLGLALSRTLARALGGDVVLAESQVGHGSVFVITVAMMTALDMAASRATAAPGARPESTTPPEPTPRLGTLVDPRSLPNLRGARILVVDDTPDICAMLEETLTLHGAAVDTAGDGAEGLALAAKTPYDVILMDIQLPEIDGYEVTRRLRALGTPSAVIALTGRASKGEQEACLAAGCDDYLSKPVSLATLVATTAAWRARGPTRS